MKRQVTDNKNADSASAALNGSAAGWENEPCSLKHEVWDGEKWVEEPLTNGQAQELMAEMFKPDSGAMFQIRDSRD